MEARLREYPGLEQLISAGDKQSRGARGREGGPSAASRMVRVPVSQVLGGHVIPAQVVGSGRGEGGASGAAPYGGSVLTLSAALEAVLFALEEPLGEQGWLRVGGGAVCSLAGSAVSRAVL